jgi:hypothetical protein
MGILCTSSFVVAPIMAGTLVNSLRSPREDGYKSMDVSTGTGENREMGEAKPLFENSIV